MRYSRTGPRLAARELIARRAATVRRLAGPRMRAAAVACIQRPDLRRRGIAEQDRRAPRREPRCTVRCSRCLLLARRTPRPYRT